jgi:hypothetical protein
LGKCALVWLSTDFEEIAMNRLLLASGLLGTVLVGGAIVAVPAAATVNLECTGTSSSFICDLSASGSSGGFSNERWKRNGVAYSVGDNDDSVKFLCSGAVSVVIGVTYTDSTGTLYGESMEYYCQQP